MEGKAGAAGGERNILVPSGGSPAILSDRNSRRKSPEFEQKNETDWRKFLFLANIFLKPMYQVHKIMFINTFASTFNPICSLLSLSTLRIESSLRSSFSKE